MINFKSVAEKMMIDFRDTASISHKEVKGRARESIIFEQYLRPYIPPRYSISSGLITDVNGNSSRQQDLVIYDEFNTPVLKDLNSEKLFFPESVLAVVEVKSQLTYDELNDIVLKSASVWGLKRSPIGQIVLVPNLIMPSANLMPLCLSVSFNSKISLESAAQRLREIRSSNPLSHALSVACLLEDKDGIAGLIINVSQNDISKIEILPTPESRIATLPCDSPGGALLYMYLILMEHLRNCGLLNSAPNLLEYAKAGNIAEPRFHVSQAEMKGASITIEGRLANVDELETFRRLSMRVFSDDVTDQEIVEWFYLLPKNPISSLQATIDKDSRIIVDGKVMSKPTPLEVYDAVHRYRENKTIEDDEELIKWFTELIRSVKKERREIRFGFFGRDKK